jgi:Protein of unknown function (DUF1304)
LPFNQGLYNAFLVAGLLWASLAAEALRRPLGMFFLSCVCVAGIFGAVTVSRRILFVQPCPPLRRLPHCSPRVERSSARAVLRLSRSPLLARVLSRK